MFDLVLLASDIDRNPLAMSERVDWQTYQLAETFGDARRRFERQWAEYRAQLDRKTSSSSD